MEIIETLSLWLGRGGLAMMLTVACLTDLRSRRIPNLIPTAGLVFALVWHAAAPSGDGLFDSAFAGALGLSQAALGATACLAVFAALYALRIVGAGDAKLMAAAGAFVGWPAAVPLMVSVLLAGGLLAVARMAVAGTAQQVWTNVQTIMIGLAVRAGGRPLVVFDPATQSADRMPYALAIATGALLHAVATWAGWISWR